MKNVIPVIFILYLISGSLHAQSILIDKGIFIEGLWCFPMAEDSLTYKYLPNRTQLAVDENKKPQFSFIRYVNSTLDETTDKASSTINQAKGGAVLHFLVTYNTSKESITEAESALRNKYFNQSIRINGPIIFEKGTYTLVSSIINMQKNEGQNVEDVTIISGSAPVLEGSKIAVSLELSREQGKLLYESFKMPTPDISLLFDMSFKGLSNAYRAELIVNWSDYQNKEAMGGSVGIYGSGAEVKKELEENFKNQSFILKTEGEDSKSEALLGLVYQKLIGLLYDEVPIEAEGLEGISEMSELVKSITSAAMKVLPYSASVMYKKKSVKRIGTSVINFNSKVPVTRNYLLAFNIGNFYKKFGENENYFKTISLEDEDFQRRDIGITLDGEIEPEFEKFINSVTVQLVKVHENEEKTIREIKITKSELGKVASSVMSYGALSDVDRLKWLEYEYRIIYEFIGGKKYETNWQSQTNAIINVYVPFERKLIELSGEAAVLEQKNVKAVVVVISYEIFDQRYHVQKTLRLKELAQAISLPIMVPSGQVNYDYKITYILQDGTEKQQNSQSNSEILFIDDHI